MAHKDVQRRVWDKAEFEARAKEREATERAGRKYETKEELDEKAARADAVHVETDPLERKDLQQYNFKDMVGQRRVVTAENALSEQAGFYCEACDYLLKDQKSYYEHCNRPQHLKRVGLPTEVKRAGADDVRARLLAHKQKDAAGKKHKNVAESKKRALEQLKAKAAAKKPEEKKKAKKEEKKPDGVAAEELEFDAAAMGLPTGFGSGRK